MTRSRSTGGVLGVLFAVAAAWLCCSPFAAPAGATTSCLGKRPTIVQLTGDVRGTAKADVIVAGGGNNVIEGRGGNDRICGGAGRDRIAGGNGSDTIDAGGGEDSVDGGNGSDRIVGGEGQDTLLGKRGNDVLDGGDGSGDFVDGGVGDDTVDGGAGDLDQAIGGIGNDKIYGGSGDGDLLRGGLGRDLYDGGLGSGDAASFAMAGQSGRVVGGRGVEVDLAAGIARNDGDDELTEIEDVVGSAFRDTIRGNSEANAIYGEGGEDLLFANGSGDSAFGGIGSDSCEGFTSVDSCEGASTLFAPPARPDAIPQLPIEVDVTGPAGTSLTVVVPVLNSLHGAGVDIAVSIEGSDWIVRAGPLPMSPGDSCSAAGPSEVRCPIAGTPDAVLLGGSNGDDHLEIDPGVPASVSARIIGEDGNDVLIGGEGDDVLDGRQGDNLLEGRGGDDALTFGKHLNGGAGSDLLIAYPCMGGILSGGPGVDSVSFARAEISIGVRATIGGTAEIAPDRTGASGFPGGCPNSEATLIGNSVESLEGSVYDDILTGNDMRNQLLGRGGDDELLGRGSDDFLVGGSGHDDFQGGDGADRLYARDDARDRSIDCGTPPAHGDVADVDTGDPTAIHCRLLRGS